MRDPAKHPTEPTDPWARPCGPLRLVHEETGERRWVRCGRSPGHPRPCQARLGARGEAEWDGERCSLSTPIDGPWAPWLLDYDADEDGCVMGDGEVG